MGENEAVTAKSKLQSSKHTERAGSVEWDLRRWIAANEDKRGAAR